MAIPTSLVDMVVPPMVHDVDERWTMAYAASLGDSRSAYLDTTSPDGVVAHHYMKEEWIRQALQHPDMMIATDAMPVLTSEEKPAPNGAGSFTKLLAQYVRDEKLIDLSQAIAMASYFPAKRLQTSTPAFEQKGRVQVGADADLLVFDLDALAHHATYTEPLTPSTGYAYVIIAGEVVMDNGVDTGARPGQR